MKPIGAKKNEQAGAYRHRQLERLLLYAAVELERAAVEVGVDEEDERHFARIGTVVVLVGMSDEEIAGPVQQKLWSFDLRKLDFEMSSGPIARAVQSADDFYAYIARDIHRSGAPDVLLGHSRRRGVHHRILRRGRDHDLADALAFRGIEKVFDRQKLQCAKERQSAHPYQLTTV